MVCYNFDTQDQFFLMLKTQQQDIRNVANMTEGMILLPTCWVVLVCAAGTLQLDKFVGQEEVELSNNIP